MLTDLAWAMAPAQGQGAEGGGSTIMSFLPLILIFVVVYKEEKGTVLIK
jgi:hypothetical protein